MEENAIVFDFSLDERDVACLDGLTTEENKATFLELYRKYGSNVTPFESSLTDSFISCNANNNKKNNNINITNLHHMSLNVNLSGV